MQTFRIRDKKSGTVIGLQVVADGVKRSADQIHSQAAGGGRLTLDVDLVSEDDLATEARDTRAPTPQGGGGATIGGARKPTRQTPELRFERPRASS